MRGEVINAVMHRSLADQWRIGRGLRDVACDHHIGQRAMRRRRNVFYVLRTAMPPARLESAQERNTLRSVARIYPNLLLHRSLVTTTSFVLFLRSTLPRGLQPFVKHLHLGQN